MGRVAMTERPLFPHSLSIAPGAAPEADSIAPQALTRSCLSKSSDLIRMKIRRISHSNPDPLQTAPGLPCSPRDAPQVFQVKVFRFAFLHPASKKSLPMRENLLDGANMEIPD